MKRQSAIVLSLMLLAAAPALAQSMQVTPNGSRPTAKGPAEYFTGNVMVNPLFAPREGSRTSGGHVTFEPGARSNWHTHPAGQALIVTSGTGWVQEWGGERRLMQPGDVIRTPPGVKHWHGATDTNSVSHIAIQETIDGKNVNWMERVTDEQYRK
jgi:quercetin dioxygenase-like cupin family protein